MKINTTVPIQKSIRFFIIMLPAFFALVKPASTMANPACIQNTNAAPIKNQTPVKTLLVALSTMVLIISSLSSIRTHSLLIFFIVPVSASHISVGVCQPMHHRSDLMWLSLTTFFRFFLKKMDMVFFQKNN